LLVIGSQHGQAPTVCRGFLAFVRTAGLVLEVAASTGRSVAEGCSNWIKPSRIWKLCVQITSVKLAFESAEITSSSKESFVGCTSAAVPDIPDGRDLRNGVRMISGPTRLLLAPDAPNGENRRSCRTVSDSQPNNQLFWHVSFKVAVVVDSPILLTRALTGSGSNRRQNDTERIRDAEGGIVRTRGKVAS
jgi:hypothetical protein